MAIIVIVKYKLLVSAKSSIKPKKYVGGTSINPIKNANIGRYFKNLRTSTNSVIKLGQRTKNQIGKYPKVNSELIL